MAASEKSIHNLELECHYLSQALGKLRQRSSEWEYLQQKLAAAEEELETMRRDQEDSHSDEPARRPYSDEPPPSVDWDGESDPARYTDRPRGAYYDDTAGSEGYRDENPLFDDTPSYLGSAGAHVPTRNSRSRVAGMPRKAAAAVVGARGWTEPRRKILGCSLFFAVAALISCILFFTLNGDGGISTDNNPGVGGITPAYTEPCAGFTVFLIPDQYGNETSWKVLRYDGVEMADLREVQESQGTVVFQGGPYSFKKEFDDGDVGGDHYEMVHATTCLPEGSYNFILYDAKGDGICCSYGRGEYGMKLSNGRVIRPLLPGEFSGNQQVTPFQIISDDIDFVPSLLEDTAGNDPTGESSSLLDTASDPCASLQLHLILDQFGNETSWKVRRYDGVDMAHLREAHEAHQGIVVLQGGPYEFDREATSSRMIHATTCLPIGIYTFILYDSKGDGICCDFGHGEYGVSLAKREIRPLTQGKFSGAGEVTPFEVTPEDIDTLPELPSSSNDPSTDEPDWMDAPEKPEEPCSSFSLQLVPDQFGNETTWELLQSGGQEGRNAQGDAPAQISQYGSRHLRETSIRQFRRDQANRPGEEQWTPVLMGGPYTYRSGFDAAADGSHYNAIIAEACLPVGSYKFVLYDAKGDGICCDSGRGEYGLNLANGRVVRPLSSGTFSGPEEVTLFSVTSNDLDGVSSTDSQEASSAIVSRPSVDSLESLVTVPNDDSAATSRGKSYGILFDVEAGTSTPSLFIAGMDLYLDSTSAAHYEMWTKAGSWQDVARSASPDYSAGFRQISHGSLTGSGGLDFAKVPLQDFQNVEIPAGHRQAFWITLSDDNLLFKSYEGEGIGRHEMANEVQAAKEELKVYYGAAVRSYPLELADPETDFWNNAGFLGRLWYKKGFMD